MPPLKAPPRKPTTATVTPTKPLARRTYATGTEDGLPGEATDQDVKMQNLRWMIVAPPGWGKTQLMFNFPNALNLAVEEGHKFMAGFKIIIDEWEGSAESTDSDDNLHISFLEAVKRIEESQRFEFISIDTVDALCKMCADYYTSTKKVEHISDLGDYGKGYDLAQNDPMRKALTTIFKSGRGIGLITHQYVTQSNFKKGVAAKKETTLPPGIFKLIMPQMDIVVHGEFGGIREGQKHRDRILKSEGSEDILAKNRGGILPPAWIVPVDPIEAQAQIREFFTGSKEERAARVKEAHEHYLSFYED
jgi:hypothetical protein